MEFEFEWNGDELVNEVKQVGAEACEEAADIVLRDCKPPVDTGELRDNGHVEKWPMQSHGTVGASVVYDLDYAAILHENPDSYVLENGEDMWLRKASNRKNDEAIDHIADRIGGVLGGD